MRYNGRKGGGQERVCVVCSDSVECILDPRDAQEVH